MVARCSVLSDGSESYPVGGPVHLAISGDGRYVAFESRTNDLDPCKTTRPGDVCPRPADQPRSRRHEQRALPARYRGAGAIVAPFMSPTCHTSGWFPGGGLMSIRSTNSSITTSGRSRSTSAGTRSCVGRYTMR